MGSNGLASALLLISTLETKIVYYNLMDRLLLIEMGQEYTKIVEDGMSKGMTRKNARVFASRKMIFDVGNENKDGDNKNKELPMDFIRDFDNILSLALEWKALLDAIGAPEVLLIGFENEDTEEWENDIPIPRTGRKDDDESTCPLPELLAPRLGLKEACLRLSGVVDMIKRLNGLDQPELRKFIAGEIQKRVRDVFGEPSEHSGGNSDSEEYSRDDGDEDDDDVSMADAEPAPIVDEMGNFTLN